MRHSTITDNGKLVSLDDPKKCIAVLEAERDKALTDMNRNAEIIFELAATRDTLRLKVIEYGQAARRYRRLYDVGYVTRFATRVRLTIAEKLLQEWMKDLDDESALSTVELCRETCGFLDTKEAPHE